MSFYVAASSLVVGTTLVAYGAHQYLTSSEQSKKKRKVQENFGLSCIKAGAVAIAIGLGAGLIYSGAMISQIPENTVTHPSVPISEKLNIGVIDQMQCGVSRSHILATPSFGGCHVLTGYHQKTHAVFMAHIDDATDVSSLSGCMKALENMIDSTGKEAVQQLDWKLSGGWKEHEESAKWGKLILEEMRKFGVPLGKIDRTFYQQKNIATPWTPRSIHQTHYFGAQIEPTNGSFSLLDSVNDEWEQNGATRLNNKVTQALFDIVRASGIKPKLEDLAKYFLTYEDNLSIPLEVTVFGE